MDLVVGIDMATADVRAAAADRDGRIHAVARRALPAQESPRPGWWVQDSRGWWPAVADTLLEVTSGLRVQPGARVVGVSVCATSGTVVALDRDGSPVGPALTYADQRARAEAQVAQEAAARRWERLGLRVQPSFGLPKWGWILAQPGVADRVVELAHAPDIVVRKLSGRMGAPLVTDWSHALKSGFDPELSEWITQATTAVGIPPEMLPKVLRPSDPGGTVGAGAAVATGLPEGCEIRMGMTDACASQLAAGAGEPGRFVSVLGTTLVLKGASRQLVVDPSGAVYSHRHPDGWWLPGGASNTGGRALTARFADREPAELDSIADGHGPASYLSYPLVGRGERFPFVAADAEGFTVGEPSSEADLIRATYEGVAFVERVGYERLAALGAPATPPVTTTGGGSTSHVWNRIRATVLGVALRPAPEANTARGACILAAAGTLHPDLATATAAMAATGVEIIEPDDETQPLEASYQRFRQAMADRGWI